MGKASRGKKRNKFLTAEAASRAKVGVGTAVYPIERGGDPISTAVFSSVCLQSAIQAIRVNDADALETWVGQFEQFSGESFFDQEFNCVANDGARVKFNATIVATELGAAECVASLLWHARTQGHRSYEEWMAGIIPTFENMTGGHPKLARITRILETFFQPENESDAFTMLKQASDCTPALAALVRSVAGGYLSHMERAELAADMHAAPQPSPSTRMRI